MKKLFIDIDDTYKDTEHYLRALLINNGYSVPDNDTIYALTNSEEGVNSIFRSVFKNYSAIPDIYGVRENFPLLETEYEIIFCSTYYSKEESLAKKIFARDLDKEIILCDGNSSNWDKSNVDMSGSAFVDDNIKILTRSNADSKYSIYNPFQFNLQLFRTKGQDIKLVSNWYELTDLLMGVEVDEDIRKRVCEGIQKYCNGSR